MTAITSCVQHSRFKIHGGHLAGASYIAILNTQSKTGERAKSSTRRALKFLELFTQLSIFGG